MKARAPSASYKTLENWNPLNLWLSFNFGLHINNKNKHPKKNKPRLETSGLKNFSLAQTETIKSKITITPPKNTKAKR